MVKSGDILLAEPFLNDETFDRSVVLIGNHTEEGSFGFVLNKQSDLILSDVIEELSDFEVPLYIGGPVEQDTLHFIYRHALPLEGTVQLTENLFWGGDFDQLKELLRQKIAEPENIRFFVGYSGWSEGQLAEELTKKTWITYKPEINDIFDIPCPDMWRDLLKKMGGKYKILANYPSDPRLN
jgi:putative transcriptional regulator